MFCQLRVSGSLTVLWNPKLGSTHQFTSRGPLDQSGSCGVEQAIYIIPHTRSEARYFSDYNCYPIRNFGGGDWLEGCQFERMKIQWSGSLVSRTKYVMMTLEW